MALTNDTQLTNLSKAMLAANAPWLTPDSSPTSAYGVSVTKMKEFFQQVMSYLTVGGTGLGSGAEVDVNVSAGVVETYVAGTGSNGGALVAGPNPVVGTVKAAKGKVS